MENFHKTVARLSEFSLYGQSDHLITGKKTLSFAEGHLLSDLGKYQIFALINLKASTNEGLHWLSCFEKHAL